MMSHDMLSRKYTNLSLSLDFFKLSISVCSFLSSVAGNCFVWSCCSSLLQTLGGMEEGRDGGWEGGGREGGRERGREGGGEYYTHVFVNHASLSTSVGTTVLLNNPLTDISSSSHLLVQWCCLGNAQATPIGYRQNKI